MQQPCSFLLDRERGKSREGPFGLRPYTGRTADEQYKEESAGCKNEILFFFLRLVCCWYAHAKLLIYSNVTYLVVVVVVV